MQKKVKNFAKILLFSYTKLNVLEKKNRFIHYFINGFFQLLCADKKHEYRI